MISPWKSFKKALASKRKNRQSAASKEVFEPRNYYYVGPTCITTACDIFPRRMGVKATAPQHCSEIQEIVRHCTARFLMVSLSCAACELLAYPFPIGYGKQGSGRLSSIHEYIFEADLFRPTVYDRV